jgi:hypothetical protein
LETSIRTLCGFGIEIPKGLRAHEVLRQLPLFV